MSDILLRLPPSSVAVNSLAGSHPRLKARVLLLDVDLPGLNGLGVLRRLAHDGVLQHTRVIMLTVRSAESEILEALELALQRHLQNMRFSHKGLGGVKHHFPLLFVPGKPPFYMVKFGQHTKVTL